MHFKRFDLQLGRRLWRQFRRSQLRYVLKVTRTKWVNGTKSVCGGHQAYMSTPGTWEGPELKSSILPGIHLKLKFRGVNLSWGDRGLQLQPQPQKVDRKRTFPCLGEGDLRLRAGIRFPGSVSKLVEHLHVFNRVFNNCT